MDYQAQALDFLTKTGTTFKAKYDGHRKYWPSDEEPRDIYQITLSRGNRSYTFSFGQSLANSGKSSPNFGKPTEYDVLACLTKNDPGTFKDFCSDFGYDCDSRRAEKVYKEVCNEWRELKALFSDVELELMQEIA